MFIDVEVSFLGNIRIESNFRSVALTLNCALFTSSLP